VNSSNIESRQSSPFLGFFENLREIRREKKFEKAGLDLFFQRLTSHIVSPETQFSSWVLAQTNSQEAELDFFSLEGLDPVVVLRKLTRDLIQFAKNKGIEIDALNINKKTEEALISLSVRAFSDCKISLSPTLEMDVVLEEDPETKEKSLLLRVMVKDDENHGFALRKKQEEEKTSREQLLMNPDILIHTIMNNEGLNINVKDTNKIVLLPNFEKDFAYEEKVVSTLQKLKRIGSYKDWVFVEPTSTQENGEEEYIIYSDRIELHFQNIFGVGWRVGVQFRENFVANQKGIVSARIKALAGEFMRTQIAGGEFGEINDNDLREFLKTSGLNDQDKSLFFSWDEIYQQFRKNIDQLMLERTEKLSYSPRSGPRAASVITVEEKNQKVLAALASNGKQQPAEAA
jgi:hypothetical protein